MEAALVILSLSLLCAVGIALWLYRSLGRERVENARLSARLETLLSQADDEERFKNLAAKALMQNSREIAEQNLRSLHSVLNPVKENLESFSRAVNQRAERDAADRAGLGEKIRQLIDLNSVVGRETRRLADALKGNSKMQGDWGEMILDNILDRCGFTKGRDYTVQETVAGADGRLRPDVIISYSEGRKIIIDSKVSIQAYLGMLDAESEERRRELGRAHVASVKKHIAELRDKSYQDYVGGDRVDFVLMFIPHEGAFLAAMNLDDSLWQTAYESRVLIISPTHLLSIVKLVEQMWRHDKQNRNALEIARQAGLMLDKFKGFVDDMDRIDRSLNQAREAWNGAFSKLTSGSGNLVGKAQLLSSLGAKAKKDLPRNYLDASLEANAEDSSEE